MKLICVESNFRLYEFKPTIFSLVAFPMEKLTIIRRCRFLKEYFCGGYKVYYLQIENNFVGYCFVTPGGRRLKCSTNRDIVIGPYFILPQFRGKGYAKILINMVFTNCTYNFKNIFCWIHETNIPSIRTVESCGMTTIGRRLNVVGKLRKLELNELGDYIVYKK